MEFIMRKALMIVSLTAFAAVAAFAAPRNSDLPETTATNDEVVIVPIDDGASDSPQKVRSLMLNHAGTSCGCDKPKKHKK
jgi:hypothetical protein